MNTQENTVLLKQEETELSNINPIYWAKDMDTVVGSTNTKYGIISVNKNGEYIIEDWNLYFKIFVDSISNTNYNLLKKLCRGLPTIEFSTNDTPYPPMIYTSVENSTTNPDYNPITKPILNKIDIGELLKTLNGNIHYEVTTNKFKNPITINYGCEISSEENRHRFVFFNLNKGGGWKLVELDYPPFE
jgi:hypothetical protein